MTPLRYLTSATLAIGLCIASLVAQAQIPQTPKTPKFYLWVDLSTGTVAGMPEMNSLPGGAPAGQQPAGGEGADAGQGVNPVPLLRGIFGR